MTDALGKEIVIGNLYGYSNRNNGIVSVVIGEAIKIKNMVTLKVIKRGNAAYNKSIKETIGDHRSISVSGNSLFPLTSVETHWIANEAKELLIK